eukprot:748533-Hanusia_phi.AAC.8
MSTTNEGSKKLMQLAQVPPPLPLILMDLNLSPQELQNRFRERIELASKLPKEKGEALRQTMGREEQANAMLDKMKMDMDLVAADSTVTSSEPSKYRHSSDVLQANAIPTASQPSWPPAQGGGKEGDAARLAPGPGRGRVLVFLLPPSQPARYHHVRTVHRQSDASKSRGSAGGKRIEPRGGVHADVKKPSVSWQRHVTQLRRLMKLKLPLALLLYRMKQRSCQTWKVESFCIEQS